VTNKLVVAKVVEVEDAVNARLLKKGLRVLDRVCHRCHRIARDEVDGACIDLSEG
jgi:cytochrome c5